MALCTIYKLPHYYTSKKNINRKVYNYSSKSNKYTLLFPLDVLTTKKVLKLGLLVALVGEAGFEPTKSETTDLQSVPFGRSGTLPNKLSNTKKR